MKKQTVTLTLRPNYNEELDALSKKEGLPKGSMVEKLMDFYRTSMQLQLKE